MNRLQISSSVPAEIAERISDRGAELTLEDEKAIERNAAALLTSADWWDEKLQGLSPITTELPKVLARVMANMDAACKGDQISRDAVFSALHIIEKIAKKDAHDEAEDKGPEWEPQS